MTDLNKIRARLDKLNKKSNPSNSILWKPVEGENLVRMVPNAKTPDDPFVELYFHYGFGGKNYLSPVSFGDRDPIKEFADQLLSGGRVSKEEYKEIMKYIPKKRTYVPIVVRGKEAEGVKWWAFGKTVYGVLLTAMNEDDIADVHKGNDIVVTFTPAKGATFAHTAVTVKRASTPLSTDAKLVKLLTTDQPDLLTAYEKVSYGDLKTALERFLHPEAGTQSEPTKTQSSEDEWASAEESTGSEDTTDFDKVFSK